MSNFYEDTLLRVEFELVQKLQKNSEFAQYVTVRYEDRVTGAVSPISTTPGSIYPEVYIVDYRMPVYVSDGRLRNDYHATAKIILSEPVLRLRRSEDVPGGDWSSNFKPFNNHVEQFGFCKGNAWEVARGLGLWFYIIALGALVNQDEFVCAEAAHMSREAYQYWITRGKKPVTNIRWPLDLVSKPEITVVSKSSVNEKPKMTVVKQEPEQPVKKFTITKK